MKEPDKPKRFRRSWEPPRYKGGDIVIVERKRPNPTTGRLIDRAKVMYAMVTRAMVEYENGDQQFVHTKLLRFADEKPRAFHPGTWMKCNGVDVQVIHYEPKWARVWVKDANNNHGLVISTTLSNPGW